MSSVTPTQSVARDSGDVNTSPPPSDTVAWTHTSNGSAFVSASTVASSAATVLEGRHANASPAPSMTWRATATVPISLSEDTSAADGDAANSTNDHWSTTVKLLSASAHRTHSGVYSDATHTGPGTGGAATSSVTHVGESQCVAVALATTTGAITTGNVSDDDTSL